MFPDDLVQQAEQLLSRLRARGLKLAAAESCTGGLLAGLLTEIAGASDVFERGWVSYSNDAKIEGLGVHGTLIADCGAVSSEVARAMAEGALVHSQAELAVAVTGIAGPGGGTPEKPVGLVHLAVARIGAATLSRECRFGEIGRHLVRIETLRAALVLLHAALEAHPSGLMSE